MKAIALGGLIGACACLTLLAFVGATFAYLQGAGAGYENPKPPHSFAAAAWGALLFILAGGGPAGLVGLVVGSAVADVRRHRKRVISQPILPTPYPPRLIWIGVSDIVLGLVPFILSGVFFVTILLEKDEWIFLLVGWFTVGLLMVVMGVRRLWDKYEPLRKAQTLRICGAGGAAAVAVWTHTDISQSPGDPTGALKSAAYILFVGSAVLLLVYLLASMVYLRIKGQGMGRTND